MSRILSPSFPSRVGASLIALVLVTGFPLVGTDSARADETNGTSLGAITVEPSSGTWDDDPANVTMGGDYACPAVADHDPGFASLYIAERGHEAPTLQSGGSDVNATALYPYSLADAGGTTDADGIALTGTVNHFPGIFAGAPIWHDAAGNYPASTQDFLDLLDATKSYSLVAACGYLDAPTGTQLLLPDATGHVAAAWSPLTLTADKSGWTIGAVKADTTVVLSAVPGAASATLTATVQSAGSTASAATGSVTFDESGAIVATATVSSGVATTTVTGLVAGQTHTYTATYVPDTDAVFNGSTSTATPVTITSARQVDGTELTSGASLVAGTKYKLTAAVATFTAGDTITAEIHSDPVVLPETSTAQSDGSTVYSFTAPSGLPAGSHELVLADAHSKTFTVAVSVAAVDGGGGDGNNDPAADGSNSPVSFATDWVGGMASTPVGVAGLFGLLLLAGALVVGGWFYFWRRRGLSAGEVASGTDGAIRS